MSALSRPAAAIFLNFGHFFATSALSRPAAAMFLNFGHLLAQKLQKLDFVFEKCCV